MSRGIRGVVVQSALLLGAVIVAVPAPAGAAGGSNGWAQREDATAPASASSYSWAGPDTGLYLMSSPGQVTVSTNASQGQDLNASFAAPAGQALQAGATYTVNAWPRDPTAAAGRLLVWRDRTMCGKTVDEMFPSYVPANPATGSFHVNEIEYDAFGQVTRFAATYEINCQYVGGPLGFEGSVAVNATAPAAPVPDAPATPGPVTGLTASNVGPDGSDTNITTLTWTNPAGIGDVDLGMAQSSNVAKLPALLGAYGTALYRGTASRYRETRIDFMDTRTYRLVPRGPSGRLGPATLLTVMGTRLDIPSSTKVTIGQEAHFSGRLSESWDYVKPADVMKGPGLVGRTIVLCRQSSVDYVDGECTVVDRTTTTTDGHFTLSARPMRNNIYSVVVPATPQMLGNSSRVVNARVAPVADLNAPESERMAARALVRRGAIIHFSTRRAPAGSTGIVRLQRFDGHRWQTVATRSLSSGPRRLAIPYRERTRGLHAYRVLKPGDTHHVNGYSKIVHVRVN
ncbi:hypothetical protein ACVW00_000468 [Marmoricola sp. URHA0025 HA25]